MHYWWWIGRMRRYGGGGGGGEHKSVKAEEKRWVFSFEIKKNWERLRSSIEPACISDKVVQYARVVQPVRFGYLPGSDINENVWRTFPGTVRTAGVATLTSVIPVSRITSVVTVVDDIHGITAVSRRTSVVTVVHDIHGTIAVSRRTGVVTVAHDIHATTDTVWTNRSNPSVTASVAPAAIANVYISPGTVRRICRTVPRAAWVGLGRAVVVTLMCCRSWRTWYVVPGVLGMS